MDIGTVFYNTSENGETYMSLVFDPVLVEKIPVLQGLKFSLRETERKDDNSPIYRVLAYKPKQRED